MKVVILAGGLGTRISEESHLRPKPMIEIGGQPILWHIMKYYSAFGFNDFVICYGYKGHVIKEYFADYYLHRSDATFDFSAENRMTIHQNVVEPWRVALVDTGPNTQTGARVKRVQKYIGDGPFMLTYRLPVVRESFHTLGAGIRRSSWDYQDTLDIVSRTERIGILSQTLFRYWSSPAQFTKAFHPEDIQTLSWQIAWLRRWLAQFGPVSRLNEDYLAAIYLGWCERLVERMLADHVLTAPEKLEQFRKLFALPETVAVLTRAGCDAQFRNLAARVAFVERIRAAVSPLGGDPGIIPEVKYKS